MNYEMPRLRITINKEAQEALVDLQRILNKPHHNIINELLIERYKSIFDDELCQKEMLSSCVVYKIQMPFCFPYECESFDFRIKDREIKLYLERVPKRYVTNRLPFITIATIIIELNNETDFPKNQTDNIVRDKIQGNTIEHAFKLLKNIIIQYRRISGKYYNIGTVKPPMIIEDFNRDVHITIYRNEEIFSTSRIMPVKETSEIIATLKLEEDIRTQIMSRMNQDITREPLSVPFDFFDQSIISYYDEEWNLCLIQGVISMESALSRLILKSKLSPIFIKKIGSRIKLGKTYKNASSLPKKIEKFLFPILKEKKLNESENTLKKIMPLLSNKKTGDGIYDLRSKIVHEGLTISANKAKMTLEIVPKFLDIIRSLIE